MLNIYRWTIVISTGLWLVLWFLPVIDSGWYTEEQMNLLMWDGWSAEIVSSQSSDWLLFAAWLSCSIGLFFTVKYTRECFVFLAIATTLLSFFWGFRVSAPLENVLISIINMADGAVIYMAYFSSVRERFK